MIFDIPVSEEAQRNEKKRTYVKVTYCNGSVCFATTTNPKEAVTKKELRRLFK